MSVRDLIPWGRSNSPAPTIYRDGEQNPFLSLHREVNRLFDEVFRNFDMRLPSINGFSANGFGWPEIEIAENEREIRVSADVPGLDEKDVEILLEDGALTLRGEKRSQTEDKHRHFSERFYGRFERRIPLAADIDEDNVQAAFRNGVLTVTLPKTAEAQSKVKRISIKS
jgi:HSP20 family protein